jgi:hypothetical protein
MQETGGRRQENGERNMEYRGFQSSIELGVRSWESGDRRQENGERNMEYRGFQSTINNQQSKIR